VNDVKGKVNFNDLKPVLMKALEKNNGLYEISGDNVVWRFGEGEEIDTDAEEENLREGNPDLTEKQAEEIVNNAFVYTHANYDGFEKQYKTTYKEEMKETIQKSNSFEEFFNALNSEDVRMDWIERQDEYEEDDFHEALAKSLNDFRKKK
jgi:hypothetical protein